MINDQPWKPGGSILLRSIEPCPGNQLRSLFHKSGPGDPWGWGPARKNLTVDLLWTSWRAKGFTTRSSLETERDDGLPIMGTPNRNEPSGTVELCWRCQTHHLNSSETKWWLDDPPKVAGYTGVHEIAALATPSPVSHDIMFWSWGKICPKPIQVAKNLPHAARLLDSPRATCYLQPHSNWMNCWVATYLILLASSMRPRQHFGFYWNCFLSCPSEKMEKLDRNWGKFLFIQYSILKILINHGITSYWNHDTRLM